MLSRAVVAQAFAMLALGWPMAAMAAAPEPTASETFAAGSRAFAAGDALHALADFLQARDDGMDGPAVWYNIGVCQYRLGRYEEAAATFRAIVERYPEMAPLAEYNGGLALFRQQRATEARAAFERAAASGDATVARLAAAMLDRLAPERATASRARPADSWVAFADASFGYDDNVALLDETSLATGASTDSPFGQFFGQLSSPRIGDAGFQGTASAYLVRYPDAGQFDQSVLQLGAAWHWRWRSWRTDAGPYYSYSTLDGHGFEQRLGGALTLTRTFEPQFRFAARLAIEDIGDLDSQFSFVEGARELLELRVTRSMATGLILLRYELSVDDRAAASVSPVRIEFLAGYHRRVSDLWSFEGAVSFRSSRYDDMDNPRDEDRTELTLTVARDLPGGWQMTGKYRISNNDSSVDGFSYDRNRIAFGLNRIFAPHF